MSNSAVKNVFKFLKLLFKEWILWLILAIDLIFVMFQLIFPLFSPPHILYILLAIIGIIWASYKVYVDTLSKIPAPSIERGLISKVDFSFVEGNEYTYAYLTWDNERKRHIGLDIIRNPDGEISCQRGKTLPDTQISIYLRIENSGETMVKILTVDGNIDFSVPYQFMLSNSYDMEDNHIDFPIEVDCKQVIILKLVAPIYPFAPITDAQIAARTRKIIAEKTKVPINVKIEFTNPNGDIMECNGTSQISLFPLTDLYIGYWFKIGKMDLVNLAKGS